MTAPFLGEVRLFANDFAPAGWLTCDGQLLPIPQNTALFSLLGTTYGGDGKSTFALPNLNGRTPLQPGQGAGLTARELGEEGGSANVTLSEAQIPQHSHQLTATTVAAGQLTPGPSVGFARNADGQLNHVYSQSMGAAQLAPANSLLAAGGGQPHNNRQPYLALLFCIAIQGTFPMRW
jgi:microcystin-dependent protein